jgi:hypothetical protein
MAVGRGGIGTQILQQQKRKNGGLLCYSKKFREMRHAMECSEKSV